MEAYLQQNPNALDNGWDQLSINEAAGVSHVGIYVGNSMMLHCGDPISYSNLNSSYWQSHFYAYARPPYN